MKRFVQLALVTLLVCAAVDAKEYYIEIEAMDRIDGDLVYAGAWSSKGLSFTAVATGVFFWTEEGGHGTFSSAIWPFAAPSASVESYYHFRLSGTPSHLRLLGTVLTARVINADRIDSGLRKSLNMAIRLNEPVDLDIGTLPDGRQMVLHTTVRDTKPTRKTTCGPGQMKLISTNYRDGKVLSKHEASRDLANTFKPVKTSFSCPKDDAASQFMDYNAKIIFSPPLTDIDTSITSTLTFIRQYAIDTLNYRRNPTDPHVRYESRYTKDITIEPGRILRIVIPPDTPAVRGFRIEDTLIIHPGPK